MLNKKLISEVMSAMGRKGGKIGGKRSLETMTPEERTARAKKASLAAAEKRTAKRLAAEGLKRDKKLSAKKRTGDRLARERARQRTPERGKAK